MSRIGILMVAVTVSSVTPCLSWDNGPAGSARTRVPSQCKNPPYGTHDWIADQVLHRLSEQERQWIEPYKAYYFLGTEAPDNSNIPAACNVPKGYGDRSKHGILWNGDEIVNYGAANRAKAEYEKAIVSAQKKDFRMAAFYLGAMTHYVADVASFGHCMEGEKNHATFEKYVLHQTSTPNATTYNDYMNTSTVPDEDAYQTTVAIATATFQGITKTGCPILPASTMDDDFSTKLSKDYKDSIGHSLDMAITGNAQLLRRFYTEAVKER